MHINSRRKDPSAQILFLNAFQRNNCLQWALCFLLEINSLAGAMAMPWQLYLALPQAVPPPHPAAADSSLWLCQLIPVCNSFPLGVWKLYFAPNPLCSSDKIQPNFANVRIFPSQWKKQKFAFSVKFVTIQVEFKKKPVPHLTANLSECLSCTPLLYIQGRQRDIIDETFCLWSVYVLFYFTCFCNIDNRLHHRAFIALCYKDTIKPFWVLIIDCVDEFGEAGNRPPTAKTLTPQD